MGTIPLLEPDDSDDQSLEWLTREQLIERGYDEALIARLPVRETGDGGQPCWRRDELTDLLAQAAREVSGNG